MTTSLVGYNKSASGKNTHIVGCSAINRRQHYCICVNFLRAVEEDRIGESFLDCQAALRNGKCRAYDMRQEEKAADIPIYFIPRVEKAPTSKPSNSTKNTELTPKLSKPEKVKKSDDELMGSDMSAVINEAVRVETKVENKLELIKPYKGESLMAFALRFRESNV